MLCSMVKILTKKDSLGQAVNLSNTMLFYYVSVGLSVRSYVMVSDRLFRHIKIVFSICLWARLLLDIILFPMFNGFGKSQI